MIRRHRSDRQVEGGEPTVNLLEYLGASRNSEKCRVRNLALASETRFRSIDGAALVRLLLIDSVGACVHM